MLLEMGDRKVKVNDMFIVPMDSNFASSANKISQKLDSASSNDVANSGLNFQDAMLNVVQNVEDTEAATKLDAYNLSIGNMDDTHTMLINAAKAEVAVQTMVQLRSKVLDSYSEIMRISL